MSTVHVVVPAGIDDPARPSGGNVYDRRVCDALADLGWNVRERHVEGSWPDPEPAALGGLVNALSDVPDGEVVLVDGLVASASASALVPAGRRLRLVVLVHLPLAVTGEDRVLAASRAVVTTSAWTRTRLLEMYALDEAIVHVAEPGSRPAAVADGTPLGENLLCVAPVSPHKGQDVLISALAAVRDLAWHCRLVGSLERDPQFVARVRAQSLRAGLAGRVELCGARTGDALTHAYETADLLVHPSRGETYGMVVTEALSHGVPVLATEVGGVPEALGDSPGGTPGLLVGADDPLGLATALRIWLTDPKTRSRLRAAAAQRRRTLPTWEATASRIAQLLTAAAA